jgi:hypothetical protein
MFEQVIPPVAGALVGVGGTVTATRWVSGQLDRQREWRNVVGAMRVVSRELGENAARIEGKGENLRHRLSIGDWDTMKSPFAGLAALNRDLWTEVSDAYGHVHEFRGGWRTDLPAPGHLRTLGDRLEATANDLEQRIRRFPWPWRAAKSG